MNVLSLFSGIGGIELGLERAGMKVIGQVEKGEYCTKVLEKHWPDVPRWGDIHDFNEGVKNKKIKIRPDIICGGFPCQPVSCAGKRKGDTDERWLWPHFRDAIRLLKPRWVLVENVPGLLSIDSGRLFSGILGDLAESGYDAEWGMLRASDVGAPHRRERVFIVAHTQQGRCRERAEETRRQERSAFIGHHTRGHAEGKCEMGNPKHSGCDGQEIPAQRREGISVLAGAGGGVSITEKVNGARPLKEGDKRGQPETKIGNACCHIPNSNNTKTSRQREHGRQIHGEPEPERFNGGSGTEWWATEPTLGSLVDGISPELDLAGMENRPIRVGEKIPERVNQLKCFGNAVVPQVAEAIGRRIMQYNNAGGGPE